MQTEPDLPARRLVDYVGGQWGLAVTGVRFLPIGDALSAHYRVEAGRRYFLKLRRGGLADLPVAAPRLLAERGRHAGGRAAADPDRPVDRRAGWLRRDAVPVRRGAHRFPA